MLLILYYYYLLVTMRSTVYAVASSPSICLSVTIYCGVKATKHIKQICLHNLTDQLFKFS